MLSKPLEMKSANCISMTGRIPISAMPVPMLMKAFSHMGVLKMRSGGYLSVSGLVTLKAPPKGPATSSPKMITSGSRANSTSSASVIAAM